MGIEDVARLEERMKAMREDINSIIKEQDIAREKNAKRDEAMAVMTTEIKQITKILQDRRSGIFLWITAIGSILNILVLIYNTMRLS